MFALLAAALAILVSSATMLAVDMYLHRKYEKSAGFNIWGYRGPAVGSKTAGEYRVALLGGSSAYGYGVDWNESIAAVLERLLAGRSAGPFQRFIVVNLGYNNEGAYSFRFTLADYLSLDYDVACLYEGYNDTMADPSNPSQNLSHEAAIMAAMRNATPTITINPAQLLANPFALKVLLTVSSTETFRKISSRSKSSP
jgi:hypothetical protein